MLRNSAPFPDNSCVVSAPFTRRVRIRETFCPMPRKPFDWTSSLVVDRPRMRDLICNATPLTPPSPPKRRHCLLHEEALPSCRFRECPWPRRRCCRQILSRSAGRSRSRVDDSRHRRLGSPRVSSRVATGRREMAMSRPRVAYCLQTPMPGQRGCHLHKLPG